MELANPDPEASKDKPSLEQLVSHKNDRASQASSEKIEVPSLDAARWRAYWTEHATRFDAQLKVRRGKPYCPSVALDELEHLPLSVADRRRLHHELAARTARSDPLRSPRFVSVQRQSLARWAS